MLRKVFFAIILIIAFQGSCTFNSAQTHLFSEPEWIEPSFSENTKRIVVASTHNFKGSLFEENINYPLLSGKFNYKLKVGGVSILKTYLDILRYRYNNDLILLDSGHIFNLDDNVQNLSHLQEHAVILKIYKEMEYDAVNLTDVDYRALKIVNPKELNIPFITSNIINLEKNLPISDYGVSPYKIINKNGVKVGIVALTSFEKVQPRNTNKFRGIYFEDPILSFLKAKKILKRNGVGIIILMSSVNSYQDLKSLVKRLPPNSVDAIISGNTYSDEKQIAGIPLLQNSGKGQFISRIEFIIDMNDNLVLKDETKIYEKTKVCHNFFRSTMDCHNHNQEELAQDRIEMIANSSYEIVPAKFLGHEIKKNPKVEKIINK